MADYYANIREQINGEHEVHELGCFYMPPERDRFYLGEFLSIKGAIHEARKYFIKCNICCHCENMAKQGNREN